MKNIRTRSIPGALVVCAVLALGLVTATAGTVASTNFEPADAPDEDDLPCVVISTDPPGASIHPRCEGSLVQVG